MTRRPDSPAVSAVNHGIARFMLTHEYERLRLYRLHLQATVDRISPLAIDLAAHGGFAIDQVARRLPLPRGWPWPPAYDPLSVPGLSWKSFGKSRSRAWPSLALLDNSSSTGLARRGVMMRAHGDWRGELGYLVREEELEVAARLGPCVLHCRKGMERLLLTAQLPETVLNAVVGLDLDRIVEHPVLRDRGYRVAGVRTNGPAAILTFRTGTLPLELPWGDELRAQMEREA